MECDIVRATGHLVGRTAGFVFKKVGQGVGGGVSNAASGIGDEIQKRSEYAGVGAVGAGVNSIVTGIGDGVGSTVQGVGSGSGKILRNSVQGVGQFVGGGKLKEMKKEKI